MFVWPIVLIAFVYDLHKLKEFWIESRAPSIERFGLYGPLSPNLQPDRVGTKKKLKDRSKNYRLICNSIKFN